MCKKIDTETKEVLSVEEKWVPFRYYSSLSGCLTGLIELVVLREGLEDICKIVQLIEQTKIDIIAALKTRGNDLLIK